MQLKFRHKVFLILLLNSLLIAVCLLLIARYYAYRNFEAYVNKVEMESLTKLVAQVSHAYQRSRSWPQVIDEMGHWLEISRMVPGPPPGRGIGHRPPHPPPPLLPDPRLVRNPEGGGPPLLGEPTPPPSIRRLSPPGSPAPPGIPPILALFDAAKRPLLGNEPYSAEVYRLKTILVDGKAVGWLGIRRHAEPTQPLDVEFLRAQSQTFYTIGGVALLLAVLVTSLLSRQILAPARELAKGARALTSRRFDTRIEVRSKDEFGQLATDFNNLAQALERYEQMRRQWLADISHELRTPLAILRGEIEAMQDGVREITPGALESLHFEVMHVGRIVHDLHDLSLIESQPFQAELTAINPLEVLAETLRSFAPRFEQQDIRLETGGSDLKHVAIRADADRLKQLFANLLENALRYVQAPGVLKIFPELKAGSLSLSFEDTGPGVPEESLGRLFDRLYRVDKARSRDQGGSGLGLAICKSIVESFEGEIAASQSAVGGLRITIIFPALTS